jgi:hypothetical protein
VSTRILNLEHEIERLRAENHRLRAEIAHLRKPPMTRSSILYPAHGSSGPARCTCSDYYR